MSGAATANAGEPRATSHMLTTHLLIRRPSVYLSLSLSLSRRRRYASIDEYQQTTRRLGGRQRPPPTFVSSATCVFMDDSTHLGPYGVFSDTRSLIFLSDRSKADGFPG